MVEVNYFDVLKKICTFFINPTADITLCVVRDVASVMRSSSSLVRVLGQNTQRIFRRHLFWKITSLCASLSVSFQHSEP